MRKAVYITLGLVLLTVLSNVSHANELTQEEKDLLSYGKREEFEFLDSYSRYKEYYVYDEDDKDYISYYENGRYYYVKDYTYKDKNEKKHYVKIKYYYDLNNYRIYEIQDYYYDSHGDKIYEKNEKNIRNYKTSDIYSQDSYTIKYIDDIKHYIYEDSYINNGKKHYIKIDYYYKNDKKIYTIKDYYYDKNDNKTYIVNVDEKFLDDSDLRYYLEYYLKYRDYKEKINDYDRYDEYEREYFYYEKDKRKYEDFKYSNLDDYLKKFNEISEVRPQYHNNQKYFKDDTIYPYDYTKTYEKNGIRYDSIASLIPNKMPPNENNWPQKSNFTRKKQDMIQELARQIEFERKSMGDSYFNQEVINNLLQKYFPNIYKNTSNSRDRLEQFLYYFGYADAFFDKYNDERDVRGFLYNYAEPLYNIYKYFESGYYTIDDINNMKYNGKMPIKETKYTKNKQTLTQREQEKYFDEKNQKIKNER